jgi:hypothetical protein
MDQAAIDYVLAVRIFHVSSIIMTHAVGARLCPEGCRSWHAAEVIRAVVRGEALLGPSVARRVFEQFAQVSQHGPESPRPTPSVVAGSFDEFTPRGSLRFSHSSPRACEIGR